MNKLIIILTTLFFLSNTSYSQSIESKIREFAKNEYPNDIDMQNYIYKQQMSAYRYMLTVTDNEVKQIAYREYPNDYSMQQYIYNLSLIHISEPTRLLSISYAVFCLKKKKKNKT